jgi:hypothetical protein
MGNADRPPARSGSGCGTGNRQAWRVELIESDDYARHAKAMTDTIADEADGRYGVAMLSPKLRALPYLVHTNRELGLMLAGKKPLASFVDVKDHFPEIVIRYLKLFDRHVAEGRIIRRDHFSDMLGPRPFVCHRILFALPDEEWRVQAMIDLMSSNESWSPEHERREGELLGYDDWMNDYWLKLSIKN